MGGLSRVSFLEREEGLDHGAAEAPLSKRGFIDRKKTTAAAAFKASPKRKGIMPAKKALVQVIRVAILSQGTPSP
jgi:hypothetical protein